MVIVISEFGIKIKNISAGTLYDVNLGTRDYFSYTEAMLNNSLFSAFLIKNGLEPIDWQIENKQQEQGA